VWCVGGVWWGVSVGCGCGGGGGWGGVGWGGGGGGGGGKRCRSNPDHQGKLHATGNTHTQIVTQSEMKRSSLNR